MNISVGSYLHKTCKLDTSQIMARPTEVSEIEKLFVETLEKMALPKAVCDKMLALPINQKWQIIQDWIVKQSTMNFESEKKQPLFWAQKLVHASINKAMLSTDDARELYVLMRGSDKEVSTLLCGIACERWNSSNLCVVYIR